MSDLCTKMATRHFKQTHAKLPSHAPFTVHVNQVVMSPTVHIPLWRHAPLIVHLHVNQVVESCPLHCTHIICGDMPHLLYTYMSVRLWSHIPSLYTHNCGGMPPLLYTHMSIKLWSHASFIVHTSLWRHAPFVVHLHVNLV